MCITLHFIINIKIGFNADVFMGRFDDNKYVNTNGQKFGGNTGVDADKKGEWI